MPLLPCVLCNLSESGRTILDLYQGGGFFYKKLLELNFKEVANDSDCDQRKMKQKRGRKNPCVVSTKYLKLLPRKDMLLNNKF